jgi:hypothetical protein
MTSLEVNREKPGGIIGMAIVCQGSTNHVFIHIFISPTVRNLKKAVLVVKADVFDRFMSACETAEAE